MDKWRIHQSDEIVIDRFFNLYGMTCNDSIFIDIINKMFEKFENLNDIISYLPLNGNTNDFGPF